VVGLRVGGVPTGSADCGAHPRGPAGGDDGGPVPAPDQAARQVVECCGLPGDAIGVGRPRPGQQLPDGLRQARRAVCGTGG
jgi:hypothetical protein